MVSAYIVDLVGPSQRAAALGINLALTFGLSGAVGNVLGAYLTSRFGAAVTFSVPIIGAFVSVVYVFVVLPESIPQTVLQQQLVRQTPPTRRGTPPLRPLQPPLAGRVPPVQIGTARAEGPGDAAGGADALHACASCGEFARSLEVVFAGFRLLRTDRSGRLGLLCVAQFVLYAIFFGFICNYQILLQTSLHLSGSESANYLAAFALCSLVTKSSIMPLRKLFSERDLIKVGFGGFGLGCLMLSVITPSPQSLLGAAVMMAVGLIAAPVLASIASSITSSSRHGAVQALLQAFASLAEGFGPAVFGCLLASAKAVTKAIGVSLPGLPYILGIAAAGFGLVCALDAIDRGGRSSANGSALGNLATPLVARSRSPLATSPLPGMFMGEPSLAVPAFSLTAREAKGAGDGGVPGGGANSRA